MGINIREVRIDNWIMQRFPNKTPIQVMSINFVNQFGEAVINGWEESEFEGIPLSSDILEKCGFGIEVIHYRYDFADGCYLLWVKDSEFQICYRGIYATAAPGKFVHQLQNLYFSLTGEELTVNL